MTTIPSKITRVIFDSSILTIRSIKCIFYLLSVNLQNSTTRVIAPVATRNQPKVENGISNDSKKHTIMPTITSAVVFGC